MNHNLPLIEEEFFDDGLCEWLAEELQLRRLVQVIGRIRNESESKLKDLILIVNAEISWIYVDDREKFTAEINEMQALSEQERLRRKADTLVRNRKFTRAVALYKRIMAGLPAADEEEFDKSFAGKVYHNMGIAYAKLFQFDEACECMGRAYQIAHTMDTLQDYLLCVRVNKGADAFDHLADELSVDEKTRSELNERIRSVTKREKPEDPDAAVAAMVYAYHRETGL